MHIEHIAMYVNDLEKTKDFFVKYFGAGANEAYHNTATDFRSYFLSFSSGARLEIMTKPQLQDEEKTLGRTGYVHKLFTSSPETSDAISYICLASANSS